MTGNNFGQNRALTVSLLVPTYNAGDSFLELLKSVEMQSFRILEKRIIDSSSSDSTVANAKSFGYTVSIIEGKDFNHGATRQRLVDQSNSDICIFLTQDSILASEDSIKNIVAAFENDSVAIAYGRQLPHKNALVLERHARLFNYPGLSQVRRWEDRRKLGFKACFCSNSFAAYRKVALEEIGGFPTNSIMGEDTLVAAKGLLKGFQVAYVAEATVYHSHSYTLLEEFRRYFDTRVFHEQNKWLISSFGRPSGEGVKFVKSEMAFVVKQKSNVFFNLSRSIFSTMAKYLGYRLGGGYKLYPKGVLRKLSMHSSFWKH